MKKNVNVWGSGKPRRELLHVDEMAKACLFVMNLGLKIYEQETRPQMAHINIGSGNDISIRDLSFMISKIIGFKGNIIFDKTKPEGPPRKLMDNSLIKNLGWVNECNLEEGLLLTYEDFLKNIDIFKDK